MANQPINAADTGKTVDSFSVIRAALAEALEHPLPHGSYTLELNFRDSRIDRFTTRWQQSHLLAYSVDMNSPHDGFISSGPFARAGNVSTCIKLGEEK